MPIQDKNFYNIASAKTLNWEPDWFGCSHFDEELQKAIGEYQQKNGLKVDGCCGPSTFKKILADREASKHLILDQLQKTQVQTTDKFVYCNDKPVKIEWDKVITFKDPGGLTASPGTYRIPKGERIIKNATLHWDNSLSAKSCHDILERRHLSVQFSIDNDGTIFQYLDTNLIAQQAGCNEYGSWNAESWGVEISNAVSLKYQSYYQSKGFGPRPIWPKVKVHDRFLGNILGFYSIQEEALKALLKAVCTHYNIPFQCPVDDSGNLIMTTFEPLLKHIWSGVNSHYHLTLDKEDVAGLDLIKLLSEIR
jgi:hypothetical protein